MNKEIFVAYEEYKRAIAELEAKCDELKPELLMAIPEDAVISTGTGDFTLSARKVWTYTPATTALEAELKEKKKEEEQLGLAEYTKGEPFIVFKAKKS